MISIPINLNKTRFQYLIVIFVVLTLLVITKDLIHSYVRNYSFYLSESVLFGTFWLIFIPVILYCKKIYQKKWVLFLPFAFSIFHLCFFSLFVFSISSLFFNQPFEIYKTLIYAFTEYGLFCVLVYGFYSLPFLRNPTPAKKLTTKEVSDKISVLHHNKVVVLKCKDILYVKSEKPYIAIVTEERTYLHNSSLKIFLKEQSSNFIQIHKSIIVNTDYIVSYTSRKNGDYDIQLENNHTVRASRSFNNNFKPFFNGISL